MTQPSPPELPVPPSPSGGDASASRRLLVIALALIVLGGGGLLGWDVLSRGKQADTFVRPVTQPLNRPAPADQASPSSSPQADQLAARIADLEVRLAQVTPSPQQPAPPSAADSQIAQLQAQLSSLENSLSIERARADRAEEAVHTTNQRLQMILRAAGALARLRTSLERGYPFEHELDEVTAALSGDADAIGRLQPLRQWAESGVASRADLRGALEILGSDIVRAAILEAPQTWWQAIVARLKAMIVVRPTPDGDIPSAGTEEGDKPPAIVARAEAKLRDDDIAGAINELAALNGAAADVAQAWVATARARVGADDTMAALDDALRSTSPPVNQSNRVPDSDSSVPNQNSAPDAAP
jgi:hypothetical protein